ncbi:hypothetical protein BYZ73_15100 [Rhodovulum viride]|uniref:Integrase catalytic domain-containing protein n=1 Tax=Rhodovulum viride TaxID=1231134 RepID=A0ABX9DDJ8_9RHOB|nr:Mu transposase C-terminal domain-containing protein [Rhodovulum viride]RAP40405.1 hypothetical protein BYZ73_15100 [Rhodovulum viride]
MTLQLNSEGRRLALSTHDRVTINGVEWRPAYSNDTGYALERADGTGVAETFSHRQLSRLASEGKLRHEPDWFLPETAVKRLEVPAVMTSALAASVRQRMTDREAFVLAFLDMWNAKAIVKTDASIEANMPALRRKAMEYLQGPDDAGPGRFGTIERSINPPSARSLRRWLKSYEGHGVSGLVDAMAKRGHRGCSFRIEEMALLMAAARKYLNINRPTIQVVYEEMVNAFADRNADRARKGLSRLIVPSKATLRRTIHGFGPFVIVAARYGEDAARKRFRPVTNGLPLTRPLQRVEMDEWTIDIMAILTSTGLWDVLTHDEKQMLGLDGSIGRWKLTVAICATTRCIVGFAISAEAKGSAALQVLHMITRDKGGWADAVGALSLWDMMGLPEHIVTDGGSAFRSALFRHACANLGITTERAIAGVPELRARIERLFRTMSISLMARLTGRTFGSVVEKGDADPTKTAALTIEDLLFAITRWTVDYYHNAPHRGLNYRSPREVWHELEAKWGVRPAPDMTTRRLVFGNTTVRKLSKEGIRLFGIHYHSEDLAESLCQNPIRDMEIRWLPEDIGAIMVCVGGVWKEVPATRPGLDGVSIQVWMAAWRNVRAADPRSRSHDWSIMLAAVRAIDERVAQARLAADMMVMEWTEKREQDVEDNLFRHVSFNDASPRPVKTDGQLGLSVPEVPITVSPVGAPSAVERPTSAVTVPATNTENPATPDTVAAPVPTKSSWIIEE